MSADKSEPPSPSLQAIDIQFVDQSTSAPEPELLQQWASLAMGATDSGLTIRVVSTDEIVELNKTYRNKSQATNVLSFPADYPVEMNIAYLGDIAICADVVLQEAQSQQKTLSEHWAHMVIHGVLHLLGYDHIQDDEAKEMESLEIQLLNDLGYANPYIEIYKQSIQ